KPRADRTFRTNLRLAAETAAHVLRNHADAALRNTQRLRELLRRAVDRLRGNPRRQPVAFPLAHNSVRLHAHVRDDVGRVLGFDNVCRLLESFVEISRFLRGTLTYVAA